MHSSQVQIHADSNANVCEINSSKTLSILCIIPQSMAQLIWVRMKKVGVSHTIQSFITWTSLMLAE